MIPEHESRRMYQDEGMTQMEIAEVYGVCCMTISLWMKEYGIEPRTNSESHSGRSYRINSAKPSKIFLDEMYHIIGMTQLEIGEEIGVCHRTISDWMRKYSIKSRTLSEYNGENNHHWKGGISFEPYCNKFNNTFKESVRNRDDFTCQLCGQKQNGQKLDVHHIHYDKSNCYPDVVALCRSCNARVNFNRDYWEQYFENLLFEKGMTNWTNMEMM